MAGRAGGKEGKEEDPRGRARARRPLAGAAGSGSVAQVGPAGRAPPGVTRAWGGGRTSRRQVAAADAPAGLAKRARHVRQGPSAARGPSESAGAARRRPLRPVLGLVPRHCQVCRPPGNVGSRPADLRSPAQGHRVSARTV